MSNTWSSLCQSVCPSVLCLSLLVSVCPHVWLSLMSYLCRHSFAVGWAILDRVSFRLHHLQRLLHSGASATRGRVWWLWRQSAGYQVTLKSASRLHADAYYCTLCVSGEEPVVVWLCSCVCVCVCVWLVVCIIVCLCVCMIVYLWLCVVGFGLFLGCHYARCFCFNLQYSFWFHARIGELHDFGLLFLRRPEQMTREVWDYVFFKSAPVPKTDIDIKVLK